MPYWSLTNAFHYHSPAQHELLFNTNDLHPDKCGLCISEHDSVLNRFDRAPSHNLDQTGPSFLLRGTWCNHINAHQWHIAACSSVSYGLYAIVQRHLMMDPPPEPLEFPSLKLPDIQMTVSQATGHSDRWADMSSDSESEGHLPSPQSSSSSDEP